MPVKPLHTRIATLVALLAVLLACGLRSPVQASASYEHIVLPFSDFGFRDDVTINGSAARFTLFIPVYPFLRGVRLHLPLHISPIADPRSTITITANGAPFFASSIKTLGRDPVLNLTVPLPRDGRNSIELGINSNLFIPGEVCTYIPTTDLWLVLRKASTLTFDEAITPNMLIVDWLHDYGNRVTIVAPPASPVNARTREIARLAYFMHQTSRWRRIAVHFASQPERGSRNVIVGNFPKSMATRGRDLLVNDSGLDLINRQLDGLLLTGSASTLEYSQPLGMGGPSRAHGVSFEDLGIATRTTTGVGDMPMSIPLSLSAIGGKPKNLHLRLLINHTPFENDDRALVKIMLNGTLVNSVALRRDGGEESFDLPIDSNVVRASNDLTIIPTYYVKRQGCEQSTIAMTVSILNKSSLTYDGVEKQTWSVGDFFRTASGRLIVLVSDPKLMDAALAFLDQLGTVNSTIKTVDLAAFNGSIPAGYDEAVAFAPLDRLTHLSPVLTSASGGFSVLDPKSRQLIYTANYSDAFGIYQTVLTSATPTMLVSYWKDASALDNIAALSPDDVSAQSSRVFVFNRERAGTGEANLTSGIPVAGADDGSIFTFAFFGMGFLTILAVAFVKWRERS